MGICSDVLPFLIDIFKTLDYYPRVSARENPSILNEIDTKISLLQNDLKKDNTEELAYQTTKEVLEEHHIDKEIIIAKQYESLETIEV